MADVLLVVAVLALLSGCRGASSGAPPAAKVFRVGYLGGGVPANNPGADTWRDEMRRLGYVEGRNLIIEWRWAEGHNERLPDLAADLVRLKVDVIFAPAEAPIGAAQAATSVIPVVFYACGDPVRQKFVSSLAHPGGNLTGVTSSCVGGQLEAKRVDLLKQLVPGASTIAVLWHATNAERDFELAEITLAARQEGMHVQSLEVRVPEDIDAAAASMRAGVDAVVVLHDPFLLANRDRVAALALAGRLPTVYEFREYVDAGGLISYGANLLDGFRRGAGVVDKLLRGARPADLPVEQPTTFELVINLKTAEAIGLTIPPDVLARASEVLK